MIKSSLLRLILILLFLCINAQKLFKNMILHFKNISWMRWNTIFYQILNKWARWKIKHILLKVRSSEIKCKNVYQQWASVQQEIMVLMLPPATLWLQMRVEYFAYAQISARNWTRISFQACDWSIFTSSWGLIVPF